VIEVCCIPTHHDYPVRSFIKPLNNYRIEPLQEVHAWDILTWRYPVPYDFYNPPEDDRGQIYVREFTKPELQFHAILNSAQQLVGFCSYGIDGQVPGGDYSKSALDIGLGMKPEFTGQGLGKGFFSAILDFARQTMSPGQIRLTVANFNKRAFRLYASFGFVSESQFTDRRNQVKYTILLADSQKLAAAHK